MRHPGGTGVRTTDRHVGVGRLRWLIAVAVVAGLLTTASGVAAQDPAEPGAGPTTDTTRTDATTSVPATGDTTPTVATAPGPAGDPDVTAPAVTLTTNRDRFSPNGDGNADKVLARVTVDEPVTLTVTVRRAGTVVKHLVRDLATGPGTLGIEWRGRDGTAHRVADGIYNVRADAVDAAGNHRAVTTPVTVDTTPPRISWVSITPEPQTGTGPSTLRFRIPGEQRAVTLRFAVTDRFGVVDRLDGVRRLPGTRQVGWRTAYADGTALYPGAYLFAATARDDVGNVGQSTLRYHRNHRSVANRPVSSVPAAGRRVAITIDDCNDGSAWSQMLGTLRARHVHASFFCIGANVATHPEQARRTVADGHTIGSHTPDHVQVDRVPASEVASRLRRDQATWWSVSHATPSPFWRPPYGIRSSGAEAAAGSVGFRWTMLWSIDPRDWDGPGADAIVSHVLGKAHPGAIILLHALPASAAALDRIITGLRARGLEPVGLAELFHAAHLDRP